LTGLPAYAEIKWRMSDLEHRGPNAWEDDLAAKTSRPRHRVTEAITVAQRFQSAGEPLRAAIREGWPRTRHRALACSDAARNPQPVAFDRRAWAGLTYTERLTSPPEKAKRRSRTFTSPHAPRLTRVSSATRPLALPSSWKSFWPWWLRGNQTRLLSAWRLGGTRKLSPSSVPWKGYGTDLANTLPASHPVTTFDHELKEQDPRSIHISGGISYELLGMRFTK
jgi:hypothetical protein